MWYLFSHNKFFSVAVICILIAIGVVGVTGSKMYDWSFEIRDIRNKSASNQLLIINFEKQLSLYHGGFAEKIDKIFTVRPDKTKLVSFLNAMDDIAGLAHLRNFALQSMDDDKLKKNQGSGNSNYLIYKVNFECSSKSLQDFLNLFDRLPYYTDIIDFYYNRNFELDIDNFGEVTLIFKIFIKQVSPKDL